MPLNQITMEEFSCAMVDSCPPYFSEHELYEMFMNNFRRHYETNRAPLGLYFHTLWFKEAKNRRAFRKFLDDMVKRQVSCDWSRDERDTPLRLVQRMNTDL